MQTQMIRLKFDVGLLKDENTDMRARITALEAQRGADMKKLDSQASKGNDDNDNGVGTFGSSLLPTCEEEEAGDAADGSAQLNKLSLVNSNYNASDRKGGAKAGSKNNPERGVLRQRSPPPLK